MMHRREFLGAITAAPIALTNCNVASVEQQSPASTKIRRFKHGLAGAPGQSLLGGPNRPLEERCKEAVRLGIQGFDLMADPADWPILKKYGLVMSMYWNRPAVLPPGWNAIGSKEAQGDFLKAFHAGIDLMAANEFPNMILLAGPRTATLSSEQAADNTVDFCNQVKAHAEDKNITLCLEFLNSKGRGAPLNSAFDNMAWGVDVIKRVNSPRVRILFDIYHAQIMGGDIVQTIRDNIQYIAHFHTGGVPGRNEIDDTQELNYRFVAKAIADLNYTGYISHEWSAAPGNDPISSLTKALEIMNV